MKKQEKKQKEMSSIMRRNIPWKVKAVSSVLSTLVMVNAVPFLAFASGAIDVSAITKPFDILKTIIYALVGGLGSIVLILGVVDLFTSISSHDVGGIKAGGFKVGAGVALVGITTIMALMGF